MNTINTEDKILDAAKQVFTEKGFDGARMQEIANTAGMNKALLHYYFRSKEKLFYKIFELAFKQFIPKMSGIFEKDISFLDKVKLFIEGYIEMLDKNPYIPLFIIREFSRNQNVLTSLVVDRFQFMFETIDSNLKIEIKEGRVREVDTKHFILNIVSMCVFPFAGKPLFANLFQLNDNEYKLMMLDRKIIIFNVVQNWLKP